MPSLNQRGIVPLLIIGVLSILTIVSLVTGIYLVQQKTNILPKAEEPSAQTGFQTGTTTPTSALSLPEQTSSVADTLSAVRNLAANIASTAIPPVNNPSEPSEPSPSSSPTPTPTPQPSPTASAGTATPLPTPIPTSSPSPTPGPSQGQYRVSFDANFTTLIDTGDGGIFGTSNEKTIPITLTGNSGRKYVWIQFFDQGSWTPATPVVVYINLL